MNQKKAKRLRRHVARDLGLNPQEREYQIGLDPHFGRFSINKEGKHVPSDTGHIILKLARGKPTVLKVCGRKAYKNLKKAA